MTIPAVRKEEHDYPGQRNLLVYELRPYGQAEARRDDMSGMREE